MRPILIVCFSIPFAASAADQKMHCPLSIEGTAVTVQAPSGWSGSARPLIRLTDGGVMRGPPQGMGYLVPSRTLTRKDRTTERFTFEAGEERWLWCSYGGNAIELSKRLDSAGTECTVTTVEKRKGAIAEMFVVCGLSPKS